MKKAVLSLKGTHELSKNEQMEINGGAPKKATPPVGLCQCVLSTNINSSPQICYTTGDPIPSGAIVLCYW